MCRCGGGCGGTCVDALGIVAACMCVDAVQAERGRVRQVSREAGAGTAMVQGTGGLAVPPAPTEREGACRQNGTWRGLAPPQQSRGEWGTGRVDRGLAKPADGTGRACAAPPGVRAKGEEVCKAEGDMAGRV
jgi:hypothetical protein